MIKARIIKYFFMSFGA